MRVAATKRPILKQKPGVKMPAPRVPASFVSVDYPQHEERVVSPQYTIRLSVRSGGEAEVSIDEEAWLPCRQSVGFWWHDWSGYRRGPHKVCARVTLPDGRRTLSECRSFVVDLT